MWVLGQKAAKYTRPPSEFIPGLWDEWTRYCFDNAITWFCSTIENALVERVNNGSEKDPRWEEKYTLSELLEDDFRLPRPPTTTERRKAIGGQVKAMFGSGSQRKGEGKSKGKDNPISPSSLVGQWLARRRKLEV